jgi:hypothetical protein
MSPAQVLPRSRKLQPPMSTQLSQGLWIWITSSALALPREVMALMTGLQPTLQAPLRMAKSSTVAVARVCGSELVMAMPTRYWLPMAMVMGAPNWVQATPSVE